MYRKYIKRILDLLVGAGVLALLCDSTNVERAGYTPSENIVAEGLDRQFKNCDQRIIVTTFASNIYRVQQVMNAAAANKRKVAVSGRSMENVIKTTCFLADMGDFAAFNEVYAKYFTSKPARSCVAVKTLPKNVLCEVELIAEV